MLSQPTWPSGSDDESSERSSPIARRPCINCGSPTDRGSHCSTCVPHVHSYDKEYERNRRILLASATHCWLCGEIATADDPLTADHIVALEAGGTNALSNLAAAHDSCNKRRGQAGTCKQP